MPGANLSDSRVRLDEGLIKLVALVAPRLAADVRGDLAKLDETGDLDAIQPRRAKVIEQWQARTLANLWQKGREAWRDVTEATRWVESHRGNK